MKNPIKAWAVCDRSGHPYLDSISLFKKSAITSYTIRRGYNWATCRVEDGASCRRVTITIDGDK